MRTLPIGRAFRAVIPVGAKVVGRSRGDRPGRKIHHGVLSSIGPSDRTLQCKHSTARNCALLRTIALPVGTGIGPTPIAKRVSVILRPVRLLRGVPPTPEQNEPHDSLTGQYSTSVSGSRMSRATISADQP